MEVGLEQYEIKALEGYIIKDQWEIIEVLILKCHWVHNISLYLEGVYVVQK